MELYPHNQEAYEKVMAAFETSNKAAIVHATGTGKSYVAGAVAKNFKKVIIVAPNDYVLEQASSVAKHAECRTYSWISQQSVVPTGYDLIWFDEFHRMGAETWSVGCQRLIYANPQAKILGSTATSERSLEKRDMADEWFENSVVSKLSLSDAWARHILRVPVYVIGVISMDDTRSDYVAKIKNAKRIGSSLKKQASVMLDQVLLNWNNAYGVPRIIRKYIDNDVERIVVFAQSISKLKECLVTLPKWFAEAGVKVANIYHVHSAMGSEAKEQMAAFESDKSDGVKILVSVDMLNEGVHVDRVDAVILFRATISKNIYMQQIGRCFAVGQKHQPIILDLADNLTKACGYDGIYEAKDRFVKEEREFANPLNKEKYDDKFQVIDTLKETRDILSQIDRLTADSRKWDEIAAYIKDFYDKNGKLPGRKDDESVYSYMNMHRQQYYIDKYPERIAFLQSLGWQIKIEDNKLSFETAFTLIKAYKAKYGKLPNTDYKPMKSIKGRLRHGMCTEEQIKRLEEIGVTHVPFMQHWMDRFNEMKAVYDATGSLESLNKDQRSWVYPQQENKAKLNEEQIRLLDSIGAFDLKKVKGYNRSEYFIDKLVKWVEEHGYLPTCSENKGLYAVWHNAYMRNPEYWQKMNEYGIDESKIKPKDTTYMDELEVFYREHGRLPKKGEPLFKPMKSVFINKKYKNYAIEHWGYQDEFEKKFYKKFEEFKKWVRDHGYLPLQHSHEEEELRMGRFIINQTKPTSRHREEMLDFCKDYKKRKPMVQTQLTDADCRDFERLKEYVTNTGRIPETDSDLYGLINRFSNVRSIKDEYIELFAPFGYGVETIQWAKVAVAMQNLMDWYNEYGRLPKSNENRPCYNTMQLAKRWKSKGIYKKWTDWLEGVGFVCETFREPVKYKEFRQRLIDYLEEHDGFLPVSNEGKIAMDFNNFRRLHREEYEAIIAKYGNKKKRNPFMEATLSDLRAYLEEYGKVPTKKENSAYHAKFKRFRLKYEEEYAKLLKDFGL